MQVGVFLEVRAAAAQVVVQVRDGQGLVVQSMRLRLRFARARPLTDGPARRVLDRFLKRNKIRRRVRLLSSSKHHEPVAYGLFVGTIILPEGTEQRLPKDELKANRVFYRITRTELIDIIKMMNDLYCKSATEQ